MARAGFVIRFDELLLLHWSPAPRQSQASPGKSPSTPSSWLFREPTRVAKRVSPLPFRCTHWLPVAWKLCTVTESILNLTCFRSQLDPTTPVTRHQVQYRFPYLTTHANLHAYVFEASCRRRTSTRGPQSPMCLIIALPPRRCPKVLGPVPPSLGSHVSVTFRSMLAQCPEEASHAEHGNHRRVPIADILSVSPTKPVASMQYQGVSPSDPSWLKK